MNDIVKKEVEVIAKFLSSHCVQNSCVNVDDCYWCQALSLYNAGYRKVNGKVVFDKEKSNVFKSEKNDKLIYKLVNDLFDCMTVFVDGQKVFLNCNFESLSHFDIFYIAAMLIDKGYRKIYDGKEII